MTDAAVTGGDRDGPVATDAGAPPGVDFVGSAAFALLLGVGLAWPERTGAVALLVAVALVQALLASSWLMSLQVPGRGGGLVVAGLAAAGADVAVSVWPHDRLGPLLGVVGLAVPAMFVHQLTRGVSRVRLSESLGSVGFLVVAEVGVTALLQLRHSFPPPQVGADVTFAVIVVACGALAVGLFTDMVLATPRFDADVPRGPLAVIASAALGAAIGHLTLRDSATFLGGRGVFLGAGIGAVVALVAVAVAMIERATPLPEAGFPRRSRTLVPVLVPVCLVAPVAFVLCLAVRT